MVPAIPIKKSVTDFIATGISSISTSHFRSFALLIPKIFSAAASSWTYPKRKKTKASMCVIYFFINIMYLNNIILRNIRFYSTNISKCRIIIFREKFDKI